jgi:hypothetical protein
MVRREEHMSTWMQVAMAVTAQVVLDLAGAAVFAWQEHVRTRANCRQIEAAAKARAFVLDQRGDQSTLLIVPESSGPDHDH